jgi:hypothetical protein
MQELTPEGLQIVRGLAQNYSVSDDAVIVLLRALVAGNGYQAQFNHPELGGMGQWSQGGMIMIGDMFNQGLKNKVSMLCEELSNRLRNQPPARRNRNHRGKAPRASVFSRGGRIQSTGGPPISASLRPQARKMTCVMPAFPPRAGWLSSRAA